MMTGRRVTLESFTPLPEGTDQYTLDFIEARGAIKLLESDAEVIVGITDPTDHVVISAIRAFHRQAIEFVSIDPVDLSGYLGKKLGEDTRDLTGTDNALDDKILLDRLANDAPIINLVNSICIDAIRSGASDIHIEAGQTAAKVRYRMDGVLRTVRTIENSRFPAVASRVKIMANLNILERRQPQDGRITVHVGKDSVDLRVSIVPVAGGESIVLRILGKTAAALTLGELGFNQRQIACLRGLLSIPHGLILVTGPTGSGKTTTLNAMIRELVSETVKIITIEDPVEFVIDGVNQIQVNEQIGLGFDTILRRVLRQDPNVIMIGEIRDRATAEIAVRSALTGHLVLSTLHTNDAVSVIPRLTNMGIEPYLIASVLRGAVAQRLVRKTCPSCAASVPTPAGQKRILSRYGLKANSVAEARGCEDCGATGFRGRTLIAETFVTDSGLEELIIGGARLAELSAYLRNTGMTDLTHEAARKIAERETTFAEASHEVVFSGEDS
jgi:type II secretory ATPase GspE/PulE/Tfp pilus assembly ATPase PilB-like protein